MKERLFLKDHTGQHAAETPHVQTVIIHLFTQYNTHLTINNLKKTAICDIQKLLLNINQIIKITIYKQWLSIRLTSDLLRMREWCSKYHCCLNIIVVYFMLIWLLLTAFYCCLSCDKCQKDFWSEDKTMRSKTVNIRGRPVIGRADYRRRY